MKKILVIRFSSIGDIVLTSPVVRCLKNKWPDAEIHYLTKEQFQPLLAYSPYINKVHLLKRDGEFSSMIHTLKAEQFDFVVDLHKSLRSLRVKLALRRPSASFPKLNFKKWVRVRLKIDLLPHIHIVERYFKAVSKINVSNDLQGLDFFIDPEASGAAEQNIVLAEKYIAFAIGANHFTKRLPEERILEICKQIKSPVVLLGGKDESDTGRRIAESAGDHIMNLCGQVDLQTSAMIIRDAQKVITHDTGMMHIAAAFKKEIISVWGNTIPEFGMYPYLPNGGSSIIMEVNKLKCRPCSKIGYQKCPKGHFHCMNKIDTARIAAEAAL